MKLHLGRYLAIMASALLFVFSVCVHASAQDDSVYKRAPSKPLPDGGLAPRAADGHPDLTGHWYVGLLGKEDATLNSGGAGNGDPNVRPFDPKVTPEEKPSFQPAALEKMKQLMEADRAAVGRNLGKLPKEQQIAALNTEIRHLSANCMPRGVPSMLLEPGHGFDFVQSSGMLAQLTELNHDYRVIPIDGRPHTNRPDPAFSGEGVGHWEGDTLVIDTIAIDQRVGVMPGWLFHSDQEHVIERISRLSMNYLDYQVTIEDPKILTRPWHSVVRHFSLSHEPILEWYCGVNAHDDEDLTFLKEEVKRLQEEK
jgi:hypothetical protein